MAPKTRAKSAKGGAKDPNPKQTMKSKLYSNTGDDEGHCGASVHVRSEDTETTLQDTAANAAANVSAAPLDSIESVDPRESAQVSSPAVPSEWNRRRMRSGQPTEEDELEVADFLVTEDFPSRWASESIAATMVQMKTDPNYCAPVQKGGET